MLILYYIGMRKIIWQTLFLEALDIHDSEGRPAIGPSSNVLVRRIDHVEGLGEKLVEEGATLSLG